MENQNVDFVIAWVDGNDPIWQESRRKYQSEYEVNSLSQWNDGESRYRDWGLLKYWFRGVERFAPWVNNIHFVTCGQTPSWLNTKHPKLRLVSHSDYIPREYLPTFNSHCIELNFHRIPGLSEQFVYFNDDMFLVGTVTLKDFFYKGLPRDSAILYPVHMVQNGIRAEINDLYVINDYFDKKKVIKASPCKWINPIYGKMLLRTACMLPFKRFSGFYVNHLPTSYLKSTYEKVWATIPDILSETCKHRFRETTDVNQWLFEYWQYAENTFIPRYPDVGRMEEGEDGLLNLCKHISNGRYKMVCCNDSKDIKNFEAVKAELQKAFDAILPVKSEYEL